VTDTRSWWEGTTREELNARAQERLRVQHQAKPSYQRDND